MGRRGADRDLWALPPHPTSQMGVSELKGPWASTAQTQLRPAPTQGPLGLLPLNTPTLEAEACRPPLSRPSLPSGNPHDQSAMINQPRRGAGEGGSDNPKINQKSILLDSGRATIVQGCLFQFLPDRPLSIPSLILSLSPSSPCPVPFSWGDTEGLSREAPGPQEVSWGWREVQG